MRTTAYGSNNSAKAITIILCLCIVAAAIWAATSDAAGGYISEKIFTPLFSKTDSITASPIAQATPNVTQSIDNQANNGLVSAKLEYAPRTVYAIQTGAFSSYENAQKAAKDAIVYGGAGYIITKDGYHKLYTSAYLKESDAQSTKAMLLTNDVDACISHIKIDGVLLEITASKEQVDALNSAHAAWTSSIDKLFEIAMDYENGNITSLQAISEITTVHADIKQSLAAIENYKDLSGVTQNLYRNLKLCESGLSSFLSSTLSDAEVSSSIKYLMMDFIYRFGQYANEISA